MPYLPPARYYDFDRSDKKDELKAEWHARVENQIDNYRNLPRFLDPLDADDTAVRDSFSWTGFPRIFDSWLEVQNRPNQIDRAHRSAEILNRYIYVKLEGRYYPATPNPSAGWMLVPELNGQASMVDAFALAERPQDEYLEWHVVRDPNTGKITRIDYSAEAPEYWETMAEGDPSLVETIYSELLKTNVPKEDLFFNGNTLCPELVRQGEGTAVIGYVPLFGGDDDFQKGQYNRLNVWNTERGIVHLTQSNNTLFAEINLAARATQRFAVRPDLQTNVDRFTLTACGGYGGVNRNSDPTIGAAVNNLALSGFRAMVSNPIGLYIGEVDLSGFRDPSKNPVDRDDILTIHRGSFEDEDGLPRVLRFSVHPPDGADYTLDQCTFDGHPLTTGGPIARKTTVVIHGVGLPADNENPIVGCLGCPCEHPTKRPKYFLVQPPCGDCPEPEDPKWEEAPVTLAPETSMMLARPLIAGPRITGRRS